MYATHATKGNAATGARKCPKDSNDVSRLTWFVALCKDGLSSCDFSDCPESQDEELPQYCDAQNADTEVP